MKLLIKFALRHALAGSAVGFLVLVMLYLLGRHPFLIPVIFDFRWLLLSCLLFLALRSFRDSRQGILFFWQGMAGGFFLHLFYGMAVSIAILLFGIFQPDFVNSYVNALTLQFQKNEKVIIERVGSEVFHQQLAKLPHTAAFDLASDYFLKSMLIGLFLSLIFSVILRKQPKF